jgi:glycosyltransferase involved in cell wall biosynthesis
MPTVSVITPVYNAAPYLKEAIESVLSQTWSDWELLLVDDGSTDGSVELAEEYVRRYAPKVRLLFHSDRKNHGVSATRNRALAEASGEYVAFLDADDVWLPHHLEVGIRAFKQYADVGLVYGKVLCIDENSKEVTKPTGTFGRIGELGAGEPHQAINAYENLLQEEFFAPLSTVLVRRTLALEVGGFPIGLRFQGEDQVICIMVARRAPMLYIPERLALYRVHGTNWSSNQSSVAIVDTQLEVFTSLVTHTQQMDRPTARGIIRMIGRYWRLEGVPLRLRLRKIGEVIWWLKAYGRLNEIARVGVRKAKSRLRRWNRWVRTRWQLTTR